MIKNSLNTIYVFCELSDLPSMYEVLVGILMHNRYMF